MLNVPFTPNPTPLEPLTYGRHWDTPDVFGKYHQSHVASKYGVPGTSLRNDQKHLKTKAADVARFDKEVDARAVRLAGRANIVAKKSEFAAKAYINPILTQPLKEISTLLEEADTWVAKPIPKGDTEREVKRWEKNMAKGNANYVGWAISSGFLAIDYQNPESGKHALHYAIMAGNVNQVEQLMKYKADSELRDRLGYFPINLCWSFWKNHPQQAQKDPQEATTCAILMTMLSYGASPNRQQQDGNSPLHRAAQYGPLRALLMLMGFQADTKVRNKWGQLPVDLARKYGKSEHVRIFGLWDMITEQMAQTDFQAIWKRFVKNVEEEISNKQTAKELLFELQVAEGMKKLDKADSRSEFKIDDTQMRHMKAEDVLYKINKVPKPWDKGWDQYVESNKPSMEEIYGLAVKVVEEKLPTMVVLAEEEESVVTEGERGEQSDSDESDVDSEKDMLQMRSKKAKSTRGLVRWAADKLPNKTERKARPWVRQSQEAKDLAALDFSRISEVVHHVETGMEVFMGTQDDLEEDDIHVEKELHFEGTEEEVEHKHYHHHHHNHNDGHTHGHHDAAGTHHHQHIVGHQLISHSGSDEETEAKRAARERVTAEHTALKAAQSKRHELESGFAGLELGSSEGEGAVVGEAGFSSLEEGSVAPAAPGTAGAGAGADVDVSGASDDGIGRGREAALLPSLPSLPSQERDQEPDPELVGLQLGGHESLFGESQSQFQSQSQSQSLVLEKESTHMRSIEADEDQRLTAVGVEADDNILGDAGSGSGSGRHSVTSQAETEASFASYTDSRASSRASSIGPRPMSKTAQRQRESAALVKMDALFNSFTKRPCTASAILIPLRSGNAPLENTEEEYSTQRLLSMLDEDKEARKEDKKSSLIGRKPVPLKSKMGAYASGVEYKVENPRTILMDRIAPRFANEREKAEETVRILAEKGGRKGDVKRQKVDLVLNRRRRFVDKLLLPPTKMEMDAFAKLKQQRRLKQEAEAEEIGAEGAFSTEEVTGSLSTVAKARKAKNVARQKFLNSTKNIPYGNTRLRSTHYMKGHFTDRPWEYVSGYYNNAGKGEETSSPG